MPIARERWCTEMKVVAFCDGLTEPTNPDGYGCCAFVVFAGEVSGRRAASRPEPLHACYACIARPGDNVTNNICEYRAVRGALRWLIENRHKKLKDCTDIEIRTDSQLVVNQVNGKWATNAVHLKVFRDECAQMLKQLGARLVWIPRDENDVADALTRVAYQQATVA
jgi:ribonuclease HI